VLAVQEYIMNLDSTFEEAPKKHYIAYRISQNIACLEVQRRRVLIYLKLDPAAVAPLPANARDVSKTGHFGTGDLELVVTT
jgi:predicted transport protein